MADIETKYETSTERLTQTGMSVSLGKDEDSGTYGLAFINLMEGGSGFVLFTREDLADLRDALNKELAS